MCSSSWVQEFQLFETEYLISSLHTVTNKSRKKYVLAPSLFQLLLRTLAGALPPATMFECQSFADLDLAIPIRAGNSRLVEPIYIQNVSIPAHFTDTFALLVMVKAYVNMTDVDRGGMAQRISGLEICLGAENDRRHANRIGSLCGSPCQRPF